MSELPPSETPQNNPFNNKSTHLPNEPQIKKQLKEEIDDYINELRQTQGNEGRIETLNLRKRLIDSHGLSLERIDNLQVIFLHYCSHIFKTGKHMTFERLQYQKSHLTMDRFFVFLKDFSLTTGKVDGVVRQVIDKNELVLLFKRVSINAKDLNFQQFISSLEKIGLLYYDAVLNYSSKQQKVAEQRKKRKQNYMRSLKRRKAALEAAKNRQNQQEKKQSELVQDNQNRKTEQDEEEPPQNEPQINDKLIEDIMNDKNVEDPIQEVKAEIAKIQQGQVQDTQRVPNAQSVSKVQTEQQQVKKGLPTSESRVQLMQLTPEQKIQYFYQLIHVDNAVSFKRKMRELNLPLFQTKHHRNMSQAQKNYEPIKQMRMEDAYREAPLESDQQTRLQQLRNKIEERKQRDKGNTPHITKQDYEIRKKKRQKEEIQAAVIVRKDPRRKKIDINDLEIDLSSLSNMAHENINFHRFNPHKLIQTSEEQDPYLEEYTTTKKTQRSEKRILSNFQSNDGRSQVMLDKMKKRAQEIEIRQRKDESKYSRNSELLISTDHQLKKNKLVDKLMKIYKQ